MAVFSTEFPVRYFETDQMKVVHHSNYIRYFENARNQMMVDLGFPIERCEEELGILIPIVSVECHYKHSAKMGDIVTVTAEYDKVPLAKMTIHQTVRNQNGDLCAEGDVVLGFIDAKTYRPVRCPEVLTKILEQNL